METKTLRGEVTQIFSVRQGLDLGSDLSKCTL